MNKLHYRPIVTYMIMIDHRDTACRTAQSYIDTEGMGKDKTVNRQLTEQVLITKQTIQRVLFSRMVFARAVSIGCMLCMC